MMVGNLITSVILLFGSIFIIYEALSLPNLAGGFLAGPGFMPICCGIFFIFCALVLAGKEVRKIATVKVQTDEGEKPYYQAELEKVSAFFSLVKGRKSDVARMVAIPVLMLAYGIGLKQIGFEISTFAFLVICMLVCGERKPFRLIVVPTVAILFVYLLFVQLLRVSIPMAFL